MGPLPLPLAVFLRACIFSSAIAFFLANIAINSFRIFVIAQVEMKSIEEKYCIRETMNLAACADRRTKR